MQDMTEFIPGLQGDIPSNSRKGVPYVGGKYELYDKFFFFGRGGWMQRFGHLTGKSKQNYIIGG